MRNKFSPAARSGFTSSYKEIEEVIEYEKAIVIPDKPDRMLVELYEVKTGNEYHVFEYDPDTRIMKCLFNPLDIKEELFFKEYPLKKLDGIEFLFTKTSNMLRLKPIWICLNLFDTA